MIIQISTSLDVWSSRYVSIYEKYSDEIRVNIVKCVRLLLRLNCLIGSVNCLLATVDVKEPMGPKAR